MTNKRAKTEKTHDLPEMTGRGVEPLSIPDIDKAVIAYERKKEKRCEASPGEISAKRDLKEQLAKYRDHLPKNEDGERFYRLDGVDYILTETLKRHRADDGEVREENL